MRLPLKRVLRLFLLIVVLGPALPAAAAVEIDEAERGIIRDVIAAQIDAFRADDGERAFSYASPMIRRQFGSAQNFMAMVRNGYPRVYRPARFEFGRLVEIEGRLAQLVHIVGDDGRPVTAVYFMERQPDGHWRIDGCTLLDTGDLAA